MYSSKVGYTLDSRTKAGTCLGYQPNSIAYKVLLEHDKMVVSTDESSAQNTESTATLDLFDMFQDL